MSRGLSLAMVLVVALGCDQQGGGGTIVPEGRGGDSGLRPEGEHEGESMAELALRLDQLTSKRSNLVAASNEDSTKCEALCELSRAICEVKTKMCTIAEERVTDPDYQNLCRKAKQQCSDASDSCIRCVERSSLEPEASCGPPVD